jgi:hypothetical protein
VTVITITEADIGTTIAPGAGVLTELVLVDPGPCASTPFLLTDGNGAIHCSDMLGLVPIDNPIWDASLLSFAVPFVDLAVQRVPRGSSWRATWS